MSGGAGWFKNWLIVGTRREGRSNAAGGEETRRDAAHLSIHLSAQSAFFATHGMFSIASKRYFFCAASLMYASMRREYISVGESEGGGRGEVSRDEATTGKTSRSRATADDVTRAGERTAVDVLDGDLEAVERAGLMESRKNGVRLRSGCACIEIPGRLARSNSKPLASSRRGEKKTRKAKRTRTSGICTSPMKRTPRFSRTMPSDAAKNARM